MAMKEYFRQKTSVVHENFGDETVIVNLDTGCYYSLQNAAGSIWELAVGGKSRSQILHDVCAAYSGERSEIAASTAAFLEELLTEQLLDAAEDCEHSNGHAIAMAGGPFAKPYLQKYTDMEELLELDPIHEIDEAGWPSAKPPTP
jgi:hypothetical protein